MLGYMILFFLTILNRTLEMVYMFSYSALYMVSNYTSFFDQIRLMLKNVMKNIYWLFLDGLNKKKKVFWGKNFQLVVRIGSSTIVILSLSIGDIVIFMVMFK